MNAKKLVTTLLAALALTSASLSAVSAQGMPPSGIDQTQAQIRVRIEQGIASGRINPREADALYQRERELHVREMQMRRDGRASPHERAALRHDLEAMRVDVERAMSRHSSASSFPATRPGSDVANAHIRARIEHGIRSGQLTPREAGRLRVQERELYHLEARFSSDGYLSRGERRQLREELAILDRDIERLMANRRYR
ncbi:hypothetical protein RY831_23115 [Noviherbaspirillum sp. CPCC 100848]|uniref:Homeobox domain-containing protein n=1 Tax=Noviherbaspirillum album TaxID=3080276 RepID=A0ABU6JEH6_9BURK|nr:hypothetical protein [Noviherbaspirillum sp. CPCC 100848]MEC4722063.1 hypothetical protein [Noviherbaspirillum sp. CPCC 100848]